MRSLLLRLRAEEGTTLIEILITVVIMGLAVVAIVGAAATSIVVSSVHRKQASSQTLLRSYADAVIASTAWPACSSVTTADYAPSAVGFTVPASYSGQYTATATAVAFWNTSSGQFTSTCAPDGGLRRISLRVSSNRGAESMDVVKRCSGSRSVGGPCP